MTDREAIIQRHSVRTYEDRRIDKDIVILINEKIKELNNVGNLNIQFIEDAGVRTFF